MFGMEIMNNFSHAMTGNGESSAEPDAETPLMRRRELPRYDTKANIRPASKVKVQICVQFFKVGEIDTLKEQFTADVVVKAKWREPSLDGQNQTSETVEFGKLWNPKLYIENSLGDPKEQLRYRLLYNDKGEAYVMEKRMIKGTFMENLELDDFPFDVQDLTITVASELPSYEVELIEDLDDHHVVNKQSFVDEQEWHLYMHTECSRRDIVIDQADNSVRRSALSVKCRAARRPGYFVWNIFVVTFLICSLAFDKYLLSAMIMLSAVCVWHALVTTLESDADRTERIVLTVLMIIYILYNIGFLIIIYVFKNVNESTVRSIKKAYLREKGRNVQNEIEKLAKMESGRPLLLGKYDADVVDYVKKLRDAGGVVNTAIVIGVAKGVVTHNDKYLLCENGGSIEITRTWGQSFLRRIGFTKRKGTKTVKTLPSDFEKKLTDFHQRIAMDVKKYDIPDDLIMNWDETGVNMVPVGEWTMSTCGAKQVTIKGLDDKRQITAVLGATLSGTLLPPQLIYEGKTTLCHPKYSFPEGWDIYHSDNHWSNTDTHLGYIDEVIIPYVHNTRDEMNLPLRQKALAIIDVYKAHRSESVIEKLRKNNIAVVYVPANCTDKLQPMDQQVNKSFKDALKLEFQTWYSGQVVNGLKEGKSVDEIIKSIDLRASVIKPIHAGWMNKVFDGLSRKTKIILDSFEGATITAAVSDARM
ncbi:hypothetical protein FSP39_007612 [Pinctada imbricata]|uniref:DDE-1 domain-containing protein n=1 Tax=Pinctada imbricata TaxID=66713 RepID=A0AA88XKS9_PINIB|nr:hypothetical protein FSP39_007612 [Pinctada imbricata]